MRKEQLTFVDEKCSAILRQQLNTDNMGNLTMAILLLTLLLLSTVLLSYYKYGFSLLILLSLLVLIAAFLSYKRRMNAVYLVNRSFADYNTVDSGDEKEYLHKKLNYLNTGISVKIQRIKSTQLFYYLVFPFYLLNIRTAFMGVQESAQLYLFLLALLMSLPVWFLVFYWGKTELEMEQIEVKNLIEQLGL